MKYKLIPEKPEKNKIKAVKKFSYPLGKIISATINATGNPAIAARGNEYGICFLTRILPSLFAKVSFLTKVVLEKYVTTIGIDNAVNHKHIVDQYENSCVFLPKPATTAVTENPKLIPNQNTKFHNLSFVSHLARAVGALFITTGSFVKSCIALSYIRFKPYTGIVPKIEVIAKQFIAIGSIIGLFLCHNPAYGATNSNEVVSRHEIKELIKAQELKHRIPSGLLLAIIKTESNLNPFALNINGKSLFFTSKEDAMNAINEAISSGVTNIDIGIAQINYRRHGENFSSLEHMLSLDANISYAAELLGKLKQKHAGWHKALRYYHSARPIHHKVYSLKVVVCWLGI